MKGYVFSYDYFPMSSPVLLCNLKTILMGTPASRTLFINVPNKSLSRKLRRIGDPSATIPIIINLVILTVLRILGALRI